MKKQISERQGTRNNKAITLIALVVTLVVLLILAGVSISMLGGENGIITQAQDAKENTRGASAKEEIDLWKSNVKKDNLTGSMTAESTENLLDRLVENGTLIQEEADKLLNKETITIGKSEISLDGTTTGGGDETTLPKNAVISKIPGEYESEDEGIVIYIMKDADGDGTIDTPDWTDVEKMQTTYDQFVWVPVPIAVATDNTDLATKNENGIYPMAVAIEGTDSKGNQNYRGVLYDFEEATDAEGEKYVRITAKAWSANSTGNREPAYLTNSSYADASGYNTVGITEDSLQEEFNAMVKSINAKKGFWVGKYETSNMSSSNTDDITQQIKVIKGTTTGISSVDWYRMYAQQKNYSKLALGNTSSMTSSMIWGSQWDQIMIWMKNVKNERVTTNGDYFVINSVGYGNYGSISEAEEYDTVILTSLPAETGSSDNFKVKNVYDFAGNLFEWSLEASDACFRVLYGGHYGDTNSSYVRADYRIRHNPCLSFGYHGSRITLY